MPQVRPSRRDPALIPLSHDHQIGLSRARDVVLALDGTVPQDLQQLAASSHRFAQTELTPHFEREEQLLIPPFAAHVGDDHADLHTFYAQHQQLRTLTDQLLSGDASLEERLQAWSTALSDHIRFEERVLFRQIQETLSTDELTALGAALADGAGPACSV